MTKFSLVSLLCFAVAGTAAIACSSDDDTTPPTPTAGAGGRIGTAGRGGAGGGGNAGKGGALNEEAGSGGEAGAIASTLYYRLGEHKGIHDALVAIVTEELKDPIIASYFSQQADTSHRPNKTDILECFTNLLSHAAGGPEEYPFTTDDGYKCRDMKPAHATLGIGAGTFDKFVGIAAGVLTDAGVAEEDVATIGAVLNMSRTDIVDKNVPSGAAPCKSPASCAVEVGEGGAGGAGGEEAGAGGTAGATAP